MPDEAPFSLDRLDRRYRLVLCDLWGCVHDGFSLFSGVADRLTRWRSEERKVVLITNAPRPCEIVQAHLDRLGLPRDSYDAMVTSGEAGIAALSGLGEPVGFIGTPSDRAVLEGRGVCIAKDGHFKDLACSGFDPDRPAIANYRGQLADLAERGVTFHCLNPDRTVMHGGVEEPCAGALADAYLALGGQVAWYGKPHEPIYRSALRIGGDPPAGAVLAIGDGLLTDVLGARRMGFDCVLVTAGVQHGRPVADDWWSDNGFGGWRPVATVATLGD